MLNRKDGGGADRDNEEVNRPGQMVLPPLGRKPSKRTRDNTYVFYVIEGAINLRVHATSMILAQGAMFMVPRGNTYMLENLSERETRLFFAQARKVKSDDANSGVQYKVSSRGGSGVIALHFEVPEEGWDDETSEQYIEKR
ncbi:hypothetical protein FISHEDRAFT_60037 [Fistulina hepatica ATCC 64428]|uniref:Mif2/CENP-C cupin domain-containing protein n=1 Tax=Fistulina hepatica ATCC 64428 TaxID=1128425 RepID=A0A0D7A921_9AGAR|nr:hypothetical protein FISHEDRAFT_60037 [Fistulina hepatica ATCC 64428]